MVTGHAARAAFVLLRFTEGELLLQAKADLKHGEFKPWVAASCEFAYSTAKRYMKAVATQKATGVALSSLSGLFDSGKPKVERLPKAEPGRWNAKISE